MFKGLGIATMKIYIFSPRSNPIMKRFFQFSFFLMVSKMAIFTGFGPHRAAGLAERSFFIFDIIIYHPKEHSL